MAKIVAVVSSNKEKVGGGVPIFYAADAEELQNVANLLEKLLDCAAHEINEQLFLIVDRHNNS